MRAQDQYHVGICVEDFQGAMDWYAKTAGYRWCEELSIDNLLVTPDRETIVPLRFTYSRDEPHLELVQAIPGTLFVPRPSSLHHLGYWSDDLEADLADLEAAGGVIDGKGYMPDGQGPLWAFASPPVGGRIELIHRSSMPMLEQWWATGTWGT